MKAADEHITRIASDALRHAQERATETADEHISRLSFHALRHAQTRAIENTEVVKYRLTSPKPYLPPELSAKKDLLVCRRCNTHLKSSKSHAPSKAYWNNLLPGDISGEIAALTEPERRLLQRIIPYVKVIKFPGRFGQYGFKGHATLFALDIFEVSEKLSEMLPRSSTDVGIVVVT
ncbi:hypothetical protein AVEN_95493-1 [Araneus ventricosus]|uniref:DUF6570 domain-containing protein n=1 Tax=Araneus ventricosus TaxID=182803 RepID=A0A4Y2DK88_ARAVE|nr:hypothetical protein AVEN_95493-1 [Araneus ventricosus]